MWVTAKTIGETVIINTDYVEMLRPEQEIAVLASGAEIMFAEGEYENFQKKLMPKRKSYAKEDEELAAYLNELHKLVGGKNAAILTPERRKKLTKLLSSMTREQLLLAATNIGKDKWLQGENEQHARWGDLDYLLRPDKAAKYAEVDNKPPKKKLF